MEFETSVKSYSGIENVEKSLQNFGKNKNIT